MQPLALFLDIDRVAPARQKMRTFASDFFSTAAPHAQHDNGREVRGVSFGKCRVDAGQHERNRRQLDHVLAEAIALGIQANVSPLRVLESALDFEMIRPGFLVLGVGLIVVALDFARAQFAKPRRAARSVEPLAP